jgi:glycosylphosphatidylinositol transamidase
MVISASWISRIGEEDGTLNMRGVSTILALAGFLKRELTSLAALIFFLTTN